jgi:hypothetical protein
MPVILKNDVFGFLATAVSATATTIVLQTGNGDNFPIPNPGDYFYATISPIAGASEIVKVTARAGDALTVIRAQEGTSAQNFTAGSRIELRVTAASVEDRVLDQDAVLRADLAASSGSSLVGYQPAGTNAVTTNVQTKLRELASPIDYGASGNSVLDLLTLTTPTITAGILIKTREGFTYEVATSSALDHHITTVGGVKLYVLAFLTGEVCPEQWGHQDSDENANFAFSAAAAYGTKMRASGVYRLLEVNIETAKLTISGGGTIIKLAAGSNALHIKADDVTIDGMLFRPSNTIGQPNWDIRLGNGVRNPKIINCNFFVNGGNTYSAIATASIDETDFPYAENVKNLIVKNNRFEGYNNPLYFFCIEGFLIEGNTFYKTWRDAIRIREAMRNGAIIGNLFEQIGLAGSQTRDCVDTAWSGDHLVIANNICRDVIGLHCFDIKGSPSLSSVSGFMSRHIVITGNICERIAGLGVVLTESQDVHPDFIYGFTVTSNVFRACNLNGLPATSNAAIQIERQVRYMNISDNQIFECLGAGINARDDVVDADGRVSSAIITGNICINNTEVGIRLNNVNGAVITGNICDNDPDLPNSGAQQIGILVAGGDVGKGAVIKHNICRNNTSTQINVFPERILAYNDNIEVGTNAYSGGQNSQRWRQPYRIFASDTGATPTGGVIERGDWIIRKAASSGVAPCRVCTTAGVMGSTAVFHDMSNLS